MDVVLLFPGQGSQKPGMGKDLSEAYSAAREVFEQADAVLQYPLTRLCFEGPEAPLTATENAQPALLAHSAAAWAVLREHLQPRVRAAAGHSLGEFTGYHAADALTLDHALRLVRRRGELMRDSGKRRPGAMAAILGLEPLMVEEVCARASREAGLVVPANYNSREQLVISGEVAGVEHAMALAKEVGAKRAIRLNVSGAFHSPLMAVATAGLRAALDEATIESPAFPVYSNVSGRPATSLDDLRTLLLDQLVSPVKWIDVVTNIAADHPGALFVEVGPGSVLTGLVRRIVPDAQTATAGTAEEVEQLLELVTQ
ncbi:MAG TPA: ACP S-malonyltransferase [Gemmatimonadaceae bacterium]|nr:ACP S-malonyltransferase [Gemmatimonadaceae bacterium]